MYAKHLSVYSTFRQTDNILYTKQYFHTPVFVFIKLKFKIWLGEKIG